MLRQTDIRCFVRTRKRGADRFGLYSEDTSTKRRKTKNCSVRSPSVSQGYDQTQCVECRNRIHVKEYSKLRPFDSEKQRITRHLIRKRCKDMSADTEAKMLDQNTDDRSGNPSLLTSILAELTSLREEAAAWRTIKSRVVKLSEENENLRQMVMNLSSELKVASASDGPLSPGHINMDSNALSRHMSPSKSPTSVRDHTGSSKSDGKGDEIARFPTWLRPRVLEVNKDAKVSAHSIFTQSDTRAAVRKSLVRLKDTAATPKDVHDHLERNSIRVSEIIELKKESKPDKLFLIECDGTHFDSLFNDELWGDDTIVIEFLGDPNPNEIQSSHPPRG